MKFARAYDWCVIFVERKSSRWSMSWARRSSTTFLPAKWRSPFRNSRIRVAFSRLVVVVERWIDVAPRGTEAVLRLSDSSPVVDDRFIDSSIESCSRWVGGECRRLKLKSASDTRRCGAVPTNLQSLA